MMIDTQNLHPKVLDSVSQQDSPAGTQFCRIFLDEVYQASPRGINSPDVREN